MLSLLIRDAVITNDEKKKDTYTFILSDLFDIYKGIKEHNNSLLSPILKEYKDSFESMFYKLKKSGVVDFSKDEKFNKLSIKSEYGDNKYFIIIPKKDSFSIKGNKTQKNKKPQNIDNYSKRSKFGNSFVFDKSNNNNNNSSDYTKNKEIKEQRKISNKKQQQRNKRNRSPVNINKGKKIMVYTIPNVSKVYNGPDESKEDNVSDGSEKDIEAPPQKFDPKQFEKIYFDIVKETEEIINKMEELGKNKKEKLKFETCDLIKRNNNKELEEKLKINKVEEKN